VPGLLPTPIPVYYTLLTAMFMHGSWGHLLGNLLYLWIFGDNLENKMGHFRFFLFYVICGVLAGLAHVIVAAFISNQALVPSLGASGAISAVLGGNLVLFPHRKVTALLGWIPLRVSLWLVLGLWIVFQVINSIGVLGGEGDGIAYAAHIGGFAAGYWLVKRFVKSP
jgi:membrane associated rhomboid family serine protease